MADSDVALAALATIRALIGADAGRGMRVAGVWATVVVVALRYSIVSVALALAMTTLL